MENLSEQLIELIRQCSVEFPKDVYSKLKEAQAEEDPNSTAYRVIDQIFKNIHMAKELNTPICQDTGTLVFYIERPSTIREAFLRDEIRKAVKRSTELCYLRPNQVDSITGKNSGDNLGPDQPYMSFTETEGEDLTIKLLLKGGGSENMSAQYKLPDTGLKAGRDLEGVRKCVIDAIYKAQGQGCSPGVIGVGIGGDRAQSHTLAKKVLFRDIYDKNENPVLAELEGRLYKELNQLKIGPMGFGGKTTVLAVKAGAMHRLPASFFVSISYMCWACRKKTMKINKNGEVFYG